jgi:hypothetical protein
MIFLLPHQSDIRHFHLTDYIRKQMVYCNGLPFRAPSTGYSTKAGMASGEAISQEAEDFD